MAKGRDRDRRRETRWRRIIREHGRSGLSIREFCRRGKLTETAFYFWRHELLRREAQRRQTEQERRRHPGPPPCGRRFMPAARARRTDGVPAFVAVRVEEHGGGRAAGRIEIELPGGLRVHVAAPVDRQALADVLSVLRLEALTAPSGVEREGEPC